MRKYQNSKSSKQYEEITPWDNPLETKYNFSSNRAFALLEDEKKINKQISARLKVEENTKISSTKDHYNNLEEKKQIIKYRHKPRNTQKRILSPKKQNIEAINQFRMVSKSCEILPFKLQAFKQLQLFTLLKLVRENLKIEQNQEEKAYVKNKYECLFPTLKSKSPQQKLKEKIQKITKLQTKKNRVFINEIVDMSCL